MARACGSSHNHRVVEGDLGVHGQFALPGPRGTTLLFAGVGFGGGHIDALSSGLAGWPPYRVSPLRYGNLELAGIMRLFVASDILRCLESRTLRAVLTLEEPLSIFGPRLAFDCRFAGTLGSSLLGSIES